MAIVESHCRGCAGSERKYSLDPSPLRALARGEREQLLRLSQGPFVELSHRRLHHAFAHQVAFRPTATALQGAAAAISYRELDRAADRLAEQLRAVGVGAGQRVGLFALRSIAAVIGMLAVVKLGAAYVAQDVAWATRRRLEHIDANAGLRAVLAPSAWLASVPQRPGLPVLALDVLAAQALASARGARRWLPPEPVLPSSSCLVHYRRSMARPSGLRVSHQNLCNLVLCGPGALSIGAGTRVAQLHPIDSDLAAWEIWGCLANGGTLLLGDEGPAATAACAEVMIASPALLALIEPAACPALHTVAVAGGQCSPLMADRWARRVSTLLLARGPAEATIVNTMSRHRRGHRAALLGAPTPNNTVYVLDESAQACALGEVGELWAGGDGVSAGYLNNAVLTQQRFRPDPFLGHGRMMCRSGELARWLPDGRLEYLGRGPCAGAESWGAGQRVGVRASLAV